jgi:hypothetical protein
MTNWDNRYPPAYDDAVAHAVQRAARHDIADYRNGCYVVWQRGQEMFVQPSGQPAPEGAKMVCMAQRWDAERVQLRFDGAYSEWRNVGQPVP